MEPTAIGNKARWRKGWAAAGPQRPSRSVRRTAVGDVVSPRAQLIIINNINISRWIIIVHMTYQHNSPCRGERYCCRHSLITDDLSSSVCSDTAAAAAAAVEDWSEAVAKCRRHYWAVMCRSTAPQTTCWSQAPLAASCLRRELLQCTRNLPVCYPRQRVREGAGIKRFCTCLWTK